MTDFQFFNIFVFWTRNIVLLLSITVVILSLTIYNATSTPMLNLLDYDTPRTDMILSDTVQDRRLIATLVAAQASIFCPLFLLMSSSTPTFSPDVHSSMVEIWRVGIEQFCQLLMPLGLIFSWLFCITFDQKIESAVVILQASSSSKNWCDVGAGVADALKYVILVVLVMEVLGICVVSFSYVSSMLISRSATIRLTDDLESNATEKRAIQ